MEIGKYIIPEITVSFKDSIEYSKRKTIEGQPEALETLKEVYKDFIQHHEECWVMYLNQANKILGVSQIAKGGITSASVDVRIILQIALKVSATAIIVSHNHPSGYSMPSNDDMKLTEQIKKACSVMSISLLDHIILTKDSYFSFASSNIL